MKRDGVRKKKLTKFTATAFIVTTVNNIAAENYLLESHNFEYVLAAVFSQDPLEIFFKQASSVVEIISALT